jgi:hypothetical protein
MHRAMVLLWVGIGLPFVLTIVVGGPDGLVPHGVFHLAYIAFLVAGLVGAILLWRATPMRVLRGYSVALALSTLAAIAGNAGEAVAVARNGGLQAGSSVYDVSLHVDSARLTVPAIMLSVVLLALTTIVATRLDRRGALVVTRP